jgi:hypothetical protein
MLFSYTPFRVKIFLMKGQKRGILPLSGGAKGINQER